MDAYLGEPDLREVLSDPLVRLVMASDGVTERAVCQLIGSVRHGQQPQGSNSVGNNAPCCSAG